MKTILLGIILVASVARLVNLGDSPPGFFYDEATGAAHSMCYQQTGRDLFGELGIFSKVDFSGFQSAPFIIGGAIWTSVAGTDFEGFRSFVAFFTVLTILGIFVLVKEITHNTELALWSTVLAACLPWAFQFSRISWDAPLGVALLVWGLVLVYRKAFNENSTPADWIWYMAGATLLTLASYTYSPIRMQLGLMLLLLPAIPWKPRIVLLLIFGVGNIAVLWSYTNPEFAQRAQLLALTSDDPRNPFRDSGYAGLLWGYLAQFGAHFSPQFLLGSGDMNLRHSIQSHGMLDWITFFGMCVGALFALKEFGKRKSKIDSDRVMIVLCCLGIFAGITPAALTWDSIPHALRAIGAWPFIVMLAGFGLSKILNNTSAKLLVSGIIVYLFAGYLYSYMVNYPQIAQWWFDTEIVESIQDTHTFPDRYLPVVRSYYRMSEFGETCESVRASIGT